MATARARASELPVLIVNGTDSPRSRIGRGLESVGSMTAETLQRLSTAVGGVVKTPVVLMAKVGGLASPRAGGAATLAAPPGSSLEERVYHLEIQMKSLEEKIGSMTIVTELDLSTHSHKEKPQIAKSLLQEIETDKMLEKRVQMLEDRVNERMERLEKALLSIQSRLDHVKLNRRENVVGYEHQESLLGESQYYDAEQQSDNFEALEAIEQSFIGAHDVPIEAIGGSPTLKKSCMKETSSATSTTTEHEEPLQEIDVGKNDDFLEPQVVSTPVYSKEAFLTQPMKSTTPSSEPVESVPRDDISKLSTSPDQQLASTLEELHGSYVMESSTASASAKFLEIARAVTAEKNTLAHASLEPQSASILEEPREAFPEEPLVAILDAKSKEHVQEDAANKNGTIITTTKSPLPPTLGAIQKDSTKELLAIAPNTKLVQELATQGVVIIALASSESPKTSKFVEEPPVAVSSAISEEPAQEDTSNKSVSMTAARESPKAFTFQDPQEDIVKESLPSAPSIGPGHELLSREDSGTISDMRLASVGPIVASKFVEEPSIVASGTNFEESTQEDIVGKSDNTIAAMESSLVSSLEDPQEEFVKEIMAKKIIASAPSVKSTQISETQEDNDIQIAAPESQMTSKFVEELPSTIPNVDSEEHAHEDVVDKTSTAIAATNSSLVSALKEPKEGFEKDTMAFAPSNECVQDMAVASSKTEGAPKFVKETTVVVPSANFGERELKVDADKSSTIIASVKSPLVSSFDNLQEDFEKESLTVALSTKPVQELVTQENSSMVHATPEITMKSKIAGDPSTVVANTSVEESLREDINKDATMTAAVESPLPTSYEGPQEDFEKESLALGPSAKPIHESSLQEDSAITSEKALASSEPQVASKFVDESPSIALSANSEEPTQENGVIKNDTVIASVKSPSASLFEESHEDFEKESMVVVPSTEPAQELEIQEESDVAPTSPESKVTSKFVEQSSTAVPSVGFEELAYEDVADKSVTTTNAREDHEDFMKESFAIPPNVGPIHELLSREDLDTTSNMAFASSTPHLESKFVEKPSPAISSANSKEPTQDEDAVKSDTKSVSADSPLASSFEEPQEDFENESLATTSSHEPAQEDLDTISNKAFASSAPHLESKFVEKPSPAIPSANSKELTQDENAVKSDTKSASADSPLASSFEEPQEDFEKKSLVATSSHEPPEELVMKEDSHMAPTSSESQEASKSIKEPLVAIPSGDFEEPTHEDAVDKSVAMTTAKVSPFTSSFGGHPKDSKESIATAPSIEPTQELATQEDSDMTPFEPQVTSKFVEESSTTDVPSAKFEEPTHKDTVGENGSITTSIESPLVSSHMEDYMKESLAIGENAKVLEPTEEDASEKSPIAFAPLETPSLSFFGIPQEAFLKEPSGLSVQPEEPIQEKSGIVFSNAESTLMSTVEDGNRATKESECKLAEDFKVHQEHIKNIEKEFPRSHSNLAHITSDESLTMEDNDDCLESDQSSEEFFDAEHDSGNFEPWEFDELKSLKEFSIGSDESTGIDVVAQKAILVSTSSMEHAQESKQALVQESAQEPEQELDQTLTREFDQDHESAKQAHAQEHEQQPVQEQEQHADGQQLTQESEHLEQQPAQECGQQLMQEQGQETGQEHGQANAEALGQESKQQSGQELGQEPIQVLEQQSTQEPAQELGHKFEQPIQEPEQEDLTKNSAMALPLLDTIDLSSTPQEALERERLIAAPTIEIAQGHDSGKSGAILTSLESQLTPTLEELQEGFVKEPLVDAKSASKSLDLGESLANKPSAATDTKLAHENVADKISVGLVEELPLTSIAEEPQNSSVSSLVEGKHGQNEVNQKFLKDVKIIAEPIEQAIPTTQSDATHVKLNPKATEDVTKLQSQGSFLAFGATSMDSKEVQLKELLPSSKLLELFEEENNSRMRGPMLVDSPITSTIDEPQKPLAVEPLASAKSTPKGHARRRGFHRSSSEPQFAYKLEEHRKALAKESSMAAIPSASKLGEEYAQEDFGDTQCLPFKILGEGKHPQKDSEFKLVEDVKSPSMKSETTSSPYVLEPKPSKIKEKKKKEKKERKPVATAEEKERRLSLGLGEMERKGSLKPEEKDSKLYSPRAEEKHKQPFRHLRDRLRHAFSVNKEP